MAGFEVGKGRAIEVGMNGKTTATKGLKLAGQLFAVYSNGKLVASSPRRGDYETHYDQRMAQR